MFAKTSNAEQYLTRTGNHSTRISRRGFHPDAPKIRPPQTFLHAFHLLVRDCLEPDLYKEIAREAEAWVESTEDQKARERETLRAQVKDRIAAIQARINELKHVQYGAMIRAKSRAAVMTYSSERDGLVKELVSLQAEARRLRPEMRTMEQRIADRVRRAVRQHRAGT